MVLQYITKNYQTNTSVVGNTPVLIVDVEIPATRRRNRSNSRIQLSEPDYQYIRCSTEGIGTATYNTEQQHPNMEHTETCPKEEWHSLKIFTQSHNNRKHKHPTLTTHSSLIHVDQYDSNHNKQQMQTAQ